MLAGLILLFAPRNLTSKFQFTFARIFRWPLTISRSIPLSAQKQQSLRDVVTRSRYERLENHLANVTEWLYLEQEKVEKLQHLPCRNILEGAGFVLADVITAHGTSLKNKVIINRGVNDSVRIGQFVLADNSIIGRVSQVSARQSQVELITGPAFNISVAIKTSSKRLDTIMRGTGKNTCTIKLLPARYKIEAGDEVFIQKEPGFLNVAMIAGRVSKVARDTENPLLWEITVKPSCNLETLETVTVIVMNPAQLSRGR